VKKKKGKKTQWAKKEKGQHEVDVLGVEGLHSKHQEHFRITRVEKNHTGNPIVNPGRLNVAM
jgi:hypothetical protein